MYETTWIQEFNSARDILNIAEINVDKVSIEVIKPLRVKYALEVISDNPLDFKKIEYWLPFLYHFPKTHWKYIIVWI